MIISFQRKFIFVAIPKTAGHAIRRGLRPALDKNDWEQCGLFERKCFPVKSLASIGHGHITCQQIQPYLLTGMWETYFTFCFVRNPYDRFVSFCFFYNRENSHMQKNPLDLMKRTFQNSQIKQQILFRPQHEFVTDSSGQLIVDYVGRFET
ncbi:MAG: sulfotransferase family 2 domain-containing protein, partial [Leptolyngbyaceae cyanobacterium MO_188.B28]|nr:sulfotransferase family 2 domain-containing protein [Leptolyngbyaceae cyanobacterium MO_188.B28]